MGVAPKGEFNMRLIRCPKCYEELHESSRQCKYCRVHIAKDEEQKRVLVIKITCPRCRHFNIAFNKFCNNCSYTLTKSCPQCGQETLFDSRICGKCKHFFNDVTRKRRKKEAAVKKESNEALQSVGTNNKKANKDHVQQIEPVVPIETSVDNNSAAELSTPEEDSNRRSLVVDDEPFIGKLVKTLLELEGYGVDVVDSVAQARSVVNERPPSLVITDIMMPDEDGYTLLKEIKSQSYTRPIQVIMLSVMSEFDDVKRSVLRGATDHIAKPFEPSELIWSVKRALGEYAAWDKKEGLIYV